MANLACGKRLSLRNQYDTKTPRASTFCCARQTDGASSGRFVARPARSRDLLASRKNLQRGFRNVRRNFFRKRILKISSGLSNHCRTCAAFPQQSQFKRSTCAGGPQAVLKDSCLVNTLWKPVAWSGHRATGPAIAIAAECSLFMSQGNRGVHAHGATCRQKRGQSGDAKNEAENREKSRRVGRSHFEEKSIEDSSQNKCAGQAKSQRDGGKEQSLSQDHACDVCRAGSESNADAEFRYPLAYRVGDHAINSDHRKHERDSRENHKQSQLESWT